MHVACVMERFDHEIQETDGAVVVGLNPTVCIGKSSAIVFMKATAGPISTSIPMAAQLR